MTTSIKDYEAKYTQLTSIVKDLESNNLTISELLEQYKTGLTLVKECADILNNVDEQRQQLIETIQITE